jgi:transposase
VAIKFCFKAGKTATETVEMVCAAYGDDALTRSNIFRWYGRLREGREDVQDDPRSGRPSESPTNGNIENVRQLLLQSHHVSLRMLTDELGTSKDTVRKTVEDLKKRKLVLAAR